jgi:hypothetical protein
MEGTAGSWIDHKPALAQVTVNNTTIIFLLMWILSINMIYYCRFTNSK